MGKSANYQTSATKACSQTRCGSQTTSRLLVLAQTRTAEDLIHTDATQAGKSWPWEMETPNPFQGPNYESVLTPTRKTIRNQLYSESRLAKPNHEVSVHHKRWTNHQVQSEVQRRRGALRAVKAKTEARPHTHSTGRHLKQTSAARATKAPIWGDWRERTYQTRMGKENAQPLCRTGVLKANRSIQAERNQESRR